MAETAVSLLFNQVSIWLQEERKLLGGLREEVEYICGEMGQMRAFLRVADAKEDSDPHLKEWVRQVREISYDTEDVLDRYMLRFAHHDAYGFSAFKKIYDLIKNLKARHQIASDIERIKLRVANVSNSQQMYKDMGPYSSSSLVTNTLYDGRGDALLLEEAEVVGFEKPKKQLLEWLRSTDYGLQVISVVGMAGLGKTTLVKKVYDNISMKMHFVHLVWITVSESFKVEHLLQDMINQLLDEIKQPPPQGLEDMNANGMREYVYNFLRNRNYVIVLDDIWRLDAWEAIRYAFPRSNTSGRGCIIITTRYNNIAKAASDESNGHVYSLEPLAAKEAKKLFYRKAFQGKQCPYYLNEISENILKRCEGLPLAIVVIGGLLHTKNNRIDEWELFNRSLCSELKEDNLKRIWTLLSLSFYDLPYYLKACFLYLGIFPEDQLLEKATVIRLWIAERFVEAKQGKTMEETAEGYLNELFNRSLIQVAETSNDGRPRNFHIHDLLREYIISKSLEQNMVVVHNQGRPDKIHNSISCTQQPCKFEYLRSLLFFGSVDSECGPILYKVLRSGCKLLKVLNLRKAPLEIIPNEVFKCYHLEYLSLRDTEVKLIPKAIGNLRKLETLDLKRSRVTELPIEILKLQRLQYLLVYRYKVDYGYIQFDNIQSFKAPYEIGKLLSLQKLCYIDAGSGVNGVKIVSEIGKLTELQRLCITKLKREDGLDLCSSLAKLTKLRSLCIYSIDESEVIDLQHSQSPPFTLSFLRTLVLQGCLERVPHWIPSLNALTDLRLRWSRLKEDPLQYLQGLPNLQVLSIHYAYEGEELSFKAGGFQKLKELSVTRLFGLRWMRVEKGSMARLNKMTVTNCKEMTEVPVGIEHLSEVEYVDFRDMAEEFVERLYEDKRIEGDRWKLKHVHGGVRVVNWEDDEWKVRLL
ncbi:hypothetical protein BUALT_Bualt10G0070100 [Buddleja alternifolia]|uniref:Disease resistance protein RPM1-like n=1 Tax=Buddleja alternifolia TaxID=168488 RepID=A0AAV6X3A0_9LAMI|nr:hypothetical protein BUALT_Bualt10G0070100 [Buddleja alternifolia]